MCEGGVGGSVEVHCDVGGRLVDLALDVEHPDVGVGGQEEVARVHPRLLGAEAQLQPERVVWLKRR